MDPEYTKDVKALQIGSPADWIKRFNVNDYKDSPQMIETLHERKQLLLVECENLQSKLDSVNKEVIDLRLKNQSLRQDLREANNYSKLAFVLSIMANVLITGGVAILVSGTSAWIGVLLIIFGLALYVVSFCVKPKVQNG